MQRAAAMLTQLRCAWCADINEAVRAMENRALLQDMQENLFTTKIQLVKPGPLSQDRTFIRKGVLMKVCPCPFPAC